MRKNWLVILLLLGATQSALSQSFYALRRPRNLIVHGGVGSSHYKGDLQDPKSLSMTRFNLLAGAEYFFKPRLSARTELTYIRLAGDDAVSKDPERRDRNLSFFSNNLELSATGTINLLPMPPRFYQRPTFNIYGFGGVGLLYTNPKTIRDNGEKIALQPVQTEGTHYSRFQPVILGGAGIKYAYNPFINLIVELGYRLSFTDHLDDVGTKRYYDHPDAGYTLTDPLAIELNKRAIGPATVRGNPDNNDGYLLLNFKLQYYLKKEIFAESQRKLYNKKRKWFYKNR
jgi:hypothetical protein